MTPFDQPLQQGEYIPQTPQLPVQAIAQSAHQLNEQVEGLRSIPNRVGEQIAETAVAPHDRETFNQIFQQRIGQLESMADDIEGLIDDPNAVTDLAGRITQDLQPFMKTRETFESTMEDLEDTQLDQVTRERAMSALSRQIQTTMDDRGNLIPADNMIGFGDEPEDLINEFQSSVKDIVRSDTNINVSRFEDAGIMEVIKQSEIPTNVLRNRLQTQIASNQEMQNWIDNRSKLKLMENEDLDINNPADRQQARNIARNDLDNFVNGFLSGNIPKIQRSLRSDTEGSAGGSSGEFRLHRGINMSFDPTGIYQEGSVRIHEQMEDARREQINTQREKIRESPSLSQHFIDGDGEFNNELLEETHEKIQQAEELNGIVRAHILRTEYGVETDDLNNPRGGIAGSPIATKDEFLSITTNNDLSESDFQEISSIIESSDSTYEDEMSNLGTQMYSPPETEQGNIIEKVKDDLAMSVVNNSEIAPHLEGPLSEEVNNLFFSMSEEDRRDAVTRILSNAKRTQISGDGSFISVQLDEAELENTQYSGLERMHIPTKARNGSEIIGRDTITMITGDDQRGEIIQSNYIWNERLPIPISSSNTPTNEEDPHGRTITQDGYTVLSDFGLNGAIRRNRGERGQRTYSIKVPDSNGEIKEYTQADEVLRRRNQLEGRVDNPLAVALEQTIGSRQASRKIEAYRGDNEGLLQALDRPYEFTSGRGVALTIINQKSQ